MAEDQGVPEAGQLPQVLDQISWRVTKERAVQIFRRWTVQNEMAGFLGRVSAGVA